METSFKISIQIEGEANPWSDLNKIPARSKQSNFVNNLPMKYLIYLIGVVALSVITGCTSDRDNGRGTYGPTYYQGYGSQDWDHGVAPNSGPNPPVNVFGPQRDYPPR